jgi:hypothetical protein
VDVDPRAVVDQIRMVRAGNGPGVELFEYEAPDQDHTFRKNSDWGGHHVAFYVRNIDKALEYLQEKGAQMRFGPFAVTAGPAAGQTINYSRTPFGTDIELISYPHGMAYQATAPIPLWTLDLQLRRPSRQHTLLICRIFRSGRRDLNSGPLVPQTSALTRLRHAP